MMKKTILLLLLIISSNGLLAQDSYEATVKVEKMIFENIVAARDSSKSMVGTINSFAFANDRKKSILKVKNKAESIHDIFKEVSKQLFGYELNTEYIEEQLSGPVTSLRSNLSNAYDAANIISKQADKIAADVKSSSIYKHHRNIQNAQDELENSLNLAIQDMHKIVQTRTDPYNTGVVSVKKSKTTIDYLDGPAYEGKTYKSVKIGEQIWMTENLDIDEFNNGDKIPYAANYEAYKKAYQQEQPVWCYYNFDPKYSFLGKFYNGYVLTDERGITPEGWEVPSYQDWWKLAAYMEKTYNSKDYDYKLKSTDRWSDYKVNGAFQENGTNETGFNAIPSSIVKFNEKEISKLGYAAWWSRTKVEDNDFFKNHFISSSIGLMPDDNLAYTNTAWLGSCLNIRLIKE